MQTVKKLALLELVAGLFGWVWIIFGLASIYFIVAALFFGGTWASVLWAVVVSVLGKWLARGFEDSKRRVAYEAELVARGFTPEEAGRAWVQAYSGGVDHLARLRAGKQASSKTQADELSPNDGLERPRGAAD